MVPNDINDKDPRKGQDSPEKKPFEQKYGAEEQQDTSTERADRPSIDLTDGSSAEDSKE